MKASHCVQGYAPLPLFLVMPCLASRGLFSSLITRTGKVVTHSLAVDGVAAVGMKLGRVLS